MQQNVQASAYWSDDGKVPGVHYEPKQTNAPATEERADGKSEKEKEHTIYARVDSFEWLSKASSMESQEQWEIKVAKTEKNFGKGSMRVRKTWNSGSDPVFTRATKISTKEADAKLEIPLPSNEEEFLAIMFLAEQGMRKDRFHFPILGTELVWEFDLFPNEDGSYHNWIKIDLEVDDLDAPLPAFPVPLAEVILPKRFKQIDEAAWESRVSSIYEQCFLSKNPFVTGQFQRELQKEAEKDQPVATGTEPTVGNPAPDQNRPEGGKPKEPDQAPAPGASQPESNGDDSNSPIPQLGW